MLHKQSTPGDVQYLLESSSGTGYYVPLRIYLGFWRMGWSLYCSSFPHEGLLIGEAISTSTLLIASAMDPTCMSSSSSGY